MSNTVDGVTSAADNSVRQITVDCHPNQMNENQLIKYNIAILKEEFHRLYETFIIQLSSWARN